MGVANVYLITLCYSENALLAMDVEQLKQIVAEHQQELAL